MIFMYPKKLLPMVSALTLALQLCVPFQVFAMDKTAKDEKHFVARTLPAAQTAGGGAIAAPVAASIGTAVHAPGEEFAASIVTFTASKKRKRNSPTPTSAPPPTSLTLTRVVGHDSALSVVAHYAQELIFQNKLFTLNRVNISKNMEYVCNSSRRNSDTTHILAQGICKTDDSIWDEPFTTDLRFPDMPEGPRLEIDWGSKRSAPNSSETNYYHHKSKGTEEDAHSEPQFIEDFNALFTRRADDLVNLLLPPVENENPVYMCGVELFGPFDMCDPCLGKLLQFRKAHQKGPSSISDAIRNKLKHRKVEFRGADEDAFVVIYQAQKPYNDVGTYNAVGENCRYKLGWYGGTRFSSKLGCPKYFDEGNFTLSQRQRIAAQPDIIYGYIHRLGANLVKCRPLTQREDIFGFNPGQHFVFPEK